MIFLLLLREKVASSEAASRMRGDRRGMCLSPHPVPRYARDDPLPQGEREDYIKPVVGQRGNAPKKKHVEAAE